MISYNKKQLENYFSISDARSWKKAGVITSLQYDTIVKALSPTFFAPNFWMRTLLFFATCIGIQGAIGLLAVLFSTHLNENIIQGLSVTFGIALLALLEYFIQAKNHYKSGVTDGLLFLGLSFFSAIFFSHFTMPSPSFMAFIALVYGGIIYFRYLNLIGIILMVLGFSYMLFQLLFSPGSLFTHFIPFIFMGVFGALIWGSFWLQKKPLSFIYTDGFVVLDFLLLTVFYLAGNYFVVRELSIELLEMTPNENGSIPYGWLFHFTTALIPLACAYLGIKNRQKLLLRMGILFTLLSVLTFKYYYSLGHPEVSITIAGAVLIAIALWAMNYLKEDKNGVTRNPILPNKWDHLNAESLVVSSSLGGGQPEETSGGAQFGGGDFGGGGAGSSY